MVKKSYFTLNRIAEFFLIAAAFLLSLRTKKFMPIPALHLADLAAIAAIIFAALSTELRSFLLTNFRRLSHYLKPLLALLVFIIIGQIFSLWRFGADPFSTAVISDYARLLINLGIFSFTALMIYRNPKLLKPISTAIVASFLIVLPVYLYSNAVIYFSASRLSGLMENSIIFGAWISVGMVLCFGFVIESTKFWSRAAWSIWLTMLSAFLWWSGARAAWLSMILAVVLFALFLWKQREWRKLRIFLFVALFVFAVGYFLIGNNQAYNMSQEQTQSFVKSRAVGLVVTPDTYYENRISEWRGNASEIYRFPLGFGFVDPKVKDKYPGYVSIFLESLVYGGIFSLIFFVAFLTRLTKKAAARLRRKLADKSTYLKISWLIAGVVVFVNIMTFNFFLVRVLWFFLGVLAGMVFHEEPEEKLGISH